MLKPEEYDVVVLGRGEVHRLVAGVAREALGGHRAAIRRRVLPQHRMPAKQERDPERESRKLLPAEAKSLG